MMIDPKKMLKDIESKFFREVDKFENTAQIFTPTMIKSLYLKAQFEVVSKILFDLQLTPEQEIKIEETAEDEIKHIRKELYENNS
jgi:hypothetical protein